MAEIGGIELPNYPDEYLTKFPAGVDDEPRMQDLPINLIPMQLQHDDAWRKGDYTTANKVIADYPDLKKSMFTAKHWNWLRDSVIAMQKFLTEFFPEFIKDLSRKIIGINDNAITSEDKELNTYSAKKIDELTGILLAENVRIPISGWVSDAGIAPYKYKYEYTNTDILGNDDLGISFDYPSRFYGGKASVEVKNGSGAGNITFVSRKIPQRELLINEIRLVRR